MPGLTPPRVAKPLERMNRWLVAARPWAVPASAMPVVFGTSLAWAYGGRPLSVPRFLWALATMMVLHSAANMLSDVLDFRRGLDSEITPASGAIVRGLLSGRQVLRGCLFLFALGTASGLLLAHRTDPVLLLVGAVGLAVGASYSLLKILALGDLAVLLNFGLLGALGAWIVQTRSFSWFPVVWALPLALLVPAILHANNWRDVDSDSPRGVVSVAARLGDRGSLVYYGGLLFSPFILTLALMTVPRLIGDGPRPMPTTFLLVFLALPNALKLWGRAVRRAAPRSPLDFVLLDAATARHNLIFGLLNTAAVLSELFLRSRGSH